MLFAPALYLGRPGFWLSVFDEYAGPSGLARPTPSQTEPGRPAGYVVMLTAARAVCLAYLGRVDEARGLVGRLLDDEGSHDDELPIEALVPLLQAAVVLEHRAVAQAVVARLACVAHLAAGDYLITCIGRHLGDAAAFVGDRAAAHAYYAQGLEAATKIRFRPELAMTHLGLAELLLEEGDESEALAHLVVAVPELRDMKMQPGLERALNLLEKVEHRAPARIPGAEGPQILTEREREVARLLAAGRSNREIADALVITEGTVEVHVKHILSKLGLRSRAQVAALAADEHA
jgi:DNA-binding CsgD family transcriptional regulator